MRSNIHTRGMYNESMNKLYSKIDSIFHNCKIVNHATVSKKTRRLITVKSTSGPIAIQTPYFHEGSLPLWLNIISISQEMGRLLHELKLRAEDLTWYIDIISIIIHHHHLHHHHHHHSRYQCCYL